jgi:hypothetical protein
MSDPELPDPAIGRSPMRAVFDCAMRSHEGEMTQSRLAISP